MHPKAIIFDMDGTIINTTHIWHDATTQLIAECGAQLSVDDEKILRRKIHSLATAEGCRIIKDMCNTAASVEELIRRKREIAHERYQQEISFVQGFQTFHTTLDREQIKSGVATNADPVTLAIADKMLGLSNFFGNHLYSIATVNNRCKPHPDIYLHVAQQLQVNPQDCIAIEDSAHGITSAQAAGMRCIGINTGKDFEQIQRADLIIEDYHELTITTLRSLL